ncbi:MAG TPA: NifB/NifX family molybdenum-iron cluster-binding protein [Desulfobacterales bacterium]|nr:NifB/NifX family molybdenum-iron cluster-binding protein [Desulfobacterales bacterium]
MKIAISAAGPSIEDYVDPRFGRCACFLIIDSVTLKFEVIENSSKNLSGGAGIEAAQRVADQGVTHVLTGRCGPKAERVLSAAGISIVDGCEGTVREAVGRFRSWDASSAQHPPVSGTPAPEPLSPAPSRPAVADRPGGSAERGSGRGMGGGGGRGMGGGGGRGMGRRCGMSDPSGPVPKRPPSAAGFQDDAARLKQEAEQLRLQLRKKEERIRHLEGRYPGRCSD